ncbi:MAG: hypothetical protein IPO27_13940 [Bacteroidetes bacterium]|nr:hypothetical protein [Bacteroidota bacterium]
MHSRKSFLEIYDKNTSEIINYMSNDIVNEISFHNVGWTIENMDLKVYLKASGNRYYDLYVTAAENNVKTIVDVGGFWGAFPLTMLQLGFEVSMTEALKYYSEYFNPFFQFLNKKGVKIIDFDPFEVTYSGDKFDMVCVMAVIEHYPHSLSFFMENVKKMLKNSGKFCFDTPNILYIKNRFNFMMGMSPLPNIKIIYKSRIPFIGHHHEYTPQEMIDLLAIADFKIDKLKMYNYSPTRQINFRNFITKPFSIIANILFPKTRELIFAIASFK